MPSARRRQPPPPQAQPPREEAPLPATWWRDGAYKSCPSAQVESLTEMLDGLKRGDYRIPPFQRRFVWTTDDVIALLDSMLRNYHVGTVITWEQWDLPEATGAFGRVTLPLRAGRAELVLDGQQRLGAIASAFLAPGFACDLVEGRFVVDDGPRPWRVPLPLLHDIVGFLDWAQTPLTPQRHHEFRLAARLFQCLQRSRIPVVRLPADWSIEQAVEMFRRLNSTGVRMSAEDLEGILRGYLATLPGRSP